MTRMSDTPWLTPEEQQEVVNRLLRWGLIKFDNKRELPLKSGGKTDIYINLREARGVPKAIKFLSRLFENPLNRLNVKSFVEVPDSVSCLAGPLSIKTGIPYLTVRGQAKEGRVANARVIGRPVSGKKVCILDDVITDGASKVVPYRECQQLGLRSKALVVLVDRQQGWQQYFASQGIDLPVWSGMTLHDVRRHLITTFGVMERCDKNVEKSNPIIVALDGKSWEQVLLVVDRLRTTGCILKVNDLLFDQGIDHLLPELSVYGRVMADLKCHDIPQTVENTCLRLRPHKPWAVAVHGSGDGEMIKAAVKTLEGSSTKVLAVTVLTSLGRDGCEKIYSCQPMDQVLRLAKIASDAGADGFVCSPEEVKELRLRYSSMTLVTPGIRSVGTPTDDQARISTPTVALESGANHLVMGRQILRADDPVAEVKRLLEDELAINLSG
jgi:orotidine-5'-phosphate decarboxylase